MGLVKLKGPSGIKGISIVGVSGNPLDIDSSGNMCVVISSGTVSISGTPSVTISSGSVTVSGNVCFATPQIVSICNASIAVTGDFNSEVCISQTGTENQIIIESITPSVGRLPQVGSYDAAVLYNCCANLCSSTVGANASIGTPTNWTTACLWNDVNGCCFAGGFYPGVFPKICVCAWGCTGGVCRCVRLLVNGLTDGTICSGTGNAVHDIVDTCNSHFGLACETNCIEIQFKSSTAMCVCVPQYCILEDDTVTPICASCFGFTKMFLKSLTLPTNAAVKLNNTNCQTITNSTGSVLTIDYQNSVEVSQINFLNGNTQVSLYGNIT